jgi:hypothetical protein
VSGVRTGVVDVGVRTARLDAVCAARDDDAGPVGGVVMAEIAGRHAGGDDTLHGQRQQQQTGHQTTPEGSVHRRFYIMSGASLKLATVARSRIAACGYADVTTGSRGAEMLYYALKILLSAAVILAVSEIAKRHSTFAALIASLPLTSLLAFVWMHVEGAPARDVADLAGQIFWLVLPSLVLFVLLPILLRAGIGFWLSLGLSMAATVASYGAMLLLLRRSGIEL